MEQNNVSKILDGMQTAIVEYRSGYEKIQPRLYALAMEMENIPELRGLVWLTAIEMKRALKLVHECDERISQWGNMNTEPELTEKEN